MQAINIAQKHHQILKKEFSNTSRTTIQMSLKYYNNSELAQQIRKRALELLAKEITENKNLNQ